MTADAELHEQRIQRIRDRTKALMVAGFYEKIDAEQIGDWVKGGLLVHVEGMLWDAEQMVRESGAATPVPYQHPPVKGKKG